MIEKPPYISVEEYVELATAIPTPATVELLNRLNKEYSYWTDVKYKTGHDCRSAKELWAFLKQLRERGNINVWNRYGIHFCHTNEMNRLCHLFDMNFGGLWGSDNMATEKQEIYLINSLMEEAISSSQMEGASTTRKVAKEMLRKEMTPRDRSQQMICNNYRTIRFITSIKSDPLTKELFLKIHEYMTDGTLENPEDAGRLRTNNDVVVENAITHEVVHTPPSFSEIPDFVTWLCDFFNDVDEDMFIHPIIRGIIIHFMIAYVHPFADGNGRTARAMFYWYMLKKRYWLTEYMSISRIIARSKKSYEKSFMQTEADGNDIGYFIKYNLDVLLKAFEDLQAYIKRKQNEKRSSERFLKLGDISSIEAEILQRFDDHKDEVMTAKDVAARFIISPTTARTALRNLTEKGYLKEIAFNKRKRGYIKSEDFDRKISQTI